MTFRSVPQELLALLGLSAVVLRPHGMVGAAANTNCWQSGRKTRQAARSCRSVGTLILLSLSGCSAQESANGIFNSSSQSVSETYSVIYDDQ